MGIIGKDVKVKGDKTSFYPDKNYEAEVLAIKNESDQDGMYVVLVLLKENGEIRTEFVGNCTLIKKEYREER